MRDFFNKEDFYHLSCLDGLTPSAIDILVDTMNRKLNKLIESQQTVYTGESYNKHWIDCETMHTTKRGKIMFIEEIAKDPCPHRVRLNSFSWVDSKTREVLAKTQMTSHCELCGVMLVAEWKTK